MKACADNCLHIISDCLILLHLVIIILCLCYYVESSDSIAAFVVTVTIIIIAESVALHATFRCVACHYLQQFCAPVP